MKARTLIPKKGMGFSFLDIGQYLNDNAFSEDLLSKESALWEYEAASDKKNHVMLCWNLLLGEEGLHKDGVRCVARRDFTVDGFLELGCHYGLEYWRQRCS